MEMSVTQLRDGLSAIRGPLHDHGDCSVERESCDYCFDDVLKSDVIRFACWEHKYCRDCIRELFAKALESEYNYPPNCCGVKKPISIQEVQDVFDAEFIEAYISRTEEYETLFALRTYCANKDCAQFLPSHTHKDRINPKAHCYNCNSVTCVGCKEHVKDENHVCQLDDEDQNLVSYGPGNRIKRCPFCGGYLTLTEACNHITCPFCRQAFCFVCLQPWEVVIKNESRDHTCPMYSDPGYDEEGYDAEGFHRDTGFDKEGYDRSGFNARGFNRDRMRRDPDDPYARFMQRVEQVRATGFQPPQRRLGPLGAQQPRPELLDLDDDAFEDALILAQIFAMENDLPHHDGDPEDPEDPVEDRDLDGDPRDPDNRDHNQDHDMDDEGHVLDNNDDALNDRTDQEDSRHDENSVGDRTIDDNRNNVLDNQVHAQLDNVDDRGAGADDNPMDHEDQQPGEEVPGADGSEQEPGHHDNEALLGLSQEEIDMDLAMQQIFAMENSISVNRTSDEMDEAPIV